MTKPVVFSNHAIEQMLRRGVERQEVEEAISSGERVPAKAGRLAFRKNLPYHGSWHGNPYSIKQVMPVVVEESNRMVVVTVYAFYFGGEG